MIRFDKIRDQVGLLARAVLDVSRNELTAKNSSRLAGEVLEVWRRDDCWVMTLRDAKEDDVAIRAHLPTSQAAPKIGFTICLLGQYEMELDPVDASFRLVFDGRSRDPEWREQETTRRKERRALIASLLAERPRKYLDTEPTHIALVTSKSSTAIQDFKAGLGHLQADIRCERGICPPREW